MSALRIARDGDVLRVTLARPETRNAFDAAFISELAEAFVDVGTTRAVVLSGDGASFCAGARAWWMRASIDLDLEANVADAVALRRMFEAVDTAPVVAPRPRPCARQRPRTVACSDMAIAGTGGLRLLRGKARDRPRGDLAVRAARDRREAPRDTTSSRASASTQRSPSAWDSSTRWPTTSKQGSARARGLRTAGPRAARHAKRLVLDRPSRARKPRGASQSAGAERDEGQEGLRAFLENRQPTGG